MARTFTDLPEELQPRPPRPADPGPARGRGPRRSSGFGPDPDLDGPDRLTEALERARGALARTLLRVGVWAVTVTLAGAALAVSALVVFRTVAHIGRNGGEAKAVHRITFAPLATRSVVYARDGSVLAELHAEQDRVPVSLDQIPPHVVRAVLDAEDDRFFEHGALDARALLRAAVSNVQAGGVEEGGSTITQQLVKIELLTSKKDVHRKLKEAILAVELQKQYTKSQILERYLNTVYFGNGAYGIEAAAQHYYGEDVGQLTVPQAVLLAGLIRFPGGADPFGNPDAAKARRDAVAERMANLGHLTPEQLQQVKDDPLPTPPPARESPSSDYFSEHVKQELLGATWLGDTPEERYNAVFNGGLKIYTTLDPQAQQIAKDSVDSILPDDPRGFTAALVSVEPATGAVRSLVGGPGFDQSKFNLVTDGDGRQVGSAFKTFTLIAALENGLQPSDLISGAAPCPIDNPEAVDPVWSPSNAEGEAAGTITIDEATYDSVNCAYARLIKLLGPQKVVDVAQRMGITNPLQPLLSITLGTEPVTPLQMASAYATLANDGVRHDPYFVDKVDGRDGTNLFKHDDKPVRAISPQIARVATQVLTHVVQYGTGTAAAIPGRAVAGKTGSTDENTDGWFVGFTNQLSTAVWMGKPEARVSMYGVGVFPRVYGGTYPAMIWGRYMRQALDGQANVPFPTPAPTPYRAPQFLQVPAAGQPGGPRLVPADGFLGGSQGGSSSPSRSTATTAPPDTASPSTRSRDTIPPATATVPPDTSPPDTSPADTSPPTTSRNRPTRPTAPAPPAT